MLAHMFHEMHEIMYRERRSMATRVYILHIWAWEHLLVMQPSLYIFVNIKAIYLDELVSIVWWPRRETED